MGGVFERSKQQVRICQQEIQNVTHRLPYCEHYLLYARLGEEQRRNVEQHVADVVFRSDQLGKKPAYLTFDDILCISVALELRKASAKQNGKQRIALLSYLDVSMHEQYKIAVRGARYLASLLDNHPLYGRESNRQLAEQLMPFLVPFVQMEDFVVRGFRRQGINPPPEALPGNNYLKCRYRAAKVLDSESHAVFSQGATIEETVQHGLSCYVTTREYTETYWR